MGKVPSFHPWPLFSEQQRRVEEQHNWNMAALWSLVKHNCLPSNSAPAGRALEICTRLEHAAQLLVWRCTATSGTCTVAAAVWAVIVSIAVAAAFSTPAEVLLSLPVNSIQGNTQLSLRLPTQQATGCCLLHPCPGTS